MSETATELENVAKLANKVEEMAKAIGTINKDGRNTHSNYTFVSHEAVTAKIAELLTTHKLGIRPSCTAYEEKEYATNSGKAGVRTVVTMQFKITDLDSGYTETEQFFGAENDTGGKSMQQAITQATKYFYFKLFKIPFGDDGDAKTTDSGKTYDKSKPHWNGYNQFDSEWVEDDKEKVLARLKSGKTADKIISELEETYQVTRQKREAIKLLATQR